MHYDPEVFRLPAIDKPKTVFKVDGLPEQDRPKSKALPHERDSVSMTKVFRDFSMKELEKVVDFQEEADQCRDLTKKLDMYTEVRIDVPALNT